MKRLLLIPVVLTSIAFAITYRVDPNGGPLTLAEDVAKAFSSWLELDETLEAEVGTNATNVFVYDDVSLLGPDTLSMTVQEQTNTRSLSVRLNPDADALMPGVLLHETGVLLGLETIRGNAVMNPMKTASSPTELQSGDISTYEAFRDFVAEDVNRDGAVDFYDLVLLSQNYGRADFNNPADLNDDGLIDEQDVELLRNAYTFTPPSENAPETDAESNVDTNDDVSEDADPADTELPDTPDAEQDTDDSTPDTDTTNDEPLESTE